MLSQSSSTLAVLAEMRNEFSVVEQLQIWAQSQQIVTPASVGSPPLVKRIVLVFCLCLD